MTWPDVLFWSVVCCSISAVLCTLIWTKNR